MTEMPKEIYAYDYEDGQSIKFVYGGPRITGDTKYIHHSTHEAVVKERDEAIRLLRGVFLLRGFLIDPNGCLMNSIDEFLKEKKDE